MKTYLTGPRARPFVTIEAWTEGDYRTSFAARVSDALAEGYQLHDTPSYFWVPASDGNGGAILAVQSLFKGNINSPNPLGNAPEPEGLAGIPVQNKTKTDS